MNVHDFIVETATGEHKPLADYAGTTLLIVNTASKCGMTPQYEGLEQLQQTFGGDQFTVLGFPCNQFGGQEPGTNEEIQEFCSVNYNVTFPVMAKIDVNGENADPLYLYLEDEKPAESGPDIEWNFTKFLIDGDGNVVKRYGPREVPSSIEPDIKALLEN
ncbi:MAG: glutathione peroxidase [Thermomicrobiales bacterium]|nr:glutathione peroxidase [Thermomicrobiales bacterium]